MSLEAAVQANTAAIEKLIAAIGSNTEILTKVDEGRTAAIDVIKSATTSSSSKATKKSEPTAAAPEPEKTPEPEQPKADDYAGDEGATRLKKLAVDWLTTSDKDEEASRKKLFAKALTKLDAIGAKGPAIGALAEDKRATLAGWIQTLAAGRSVEELEDEGNGLLD